MCLLLSVFRFFQRLILHQLSKQILCFTGFHDQFAQLQLQTKTVQAKSQQTETVPVPAGKAFVQKNQAPVTKSVQTDPASRSVTPKLPSDICRLIACLNDSTPLVDERFTLIALCRSAPRLDIPVRLDR